MGEVGRTGERLFDTALQCGTVGGFNDDLRIEHFVLGHEEIGTVRERLAKMGMCVLVSGLKARLKFGMADWKFSHLERFGRGVELAVGSPEFDVNRPGITGETSHPEDAAGAND